MVKVDFYANLVVFEDWEFYTTNEILTDLKVIEDNSLSHLLKFCKQVPENVRFSLLVKIEWDLSYTSGPRWSHSIINCLA